MIYTSFPALEEFILTMQGRSYEMQKLDLLASTTYVGTALTKEDLSSVFCAELLTASYKVMGLLPPNTNPTNCVPRTFTSNQRLVGKFKLLRNCSLDKEVRIKCSKTREQLEAEFLLANPEQAKRESHALTESLHVTSKLFILYVHKQVILIIYFSSQGRK